MGTAAVCVVDGVLVVMHSSQCELTRAEVALLRRSSPLGITELKYQRDYCSM